MFVSASLHEKWEILSLTTKAIIRADKMSNRIIKNDELDALVKKGEDSQKAREAAMEKRRKEEELRQKENMKRMSQDGGTVSQQNRRKGV
ncbi:hypothetical protein TruAng_007674 [Truncatella angustata]|nr:hypothetical protein TruAng_007674 [Truncatella angustata]